MSAVAVALSLAPIAFDLVERLIDECGEDPIALAELEQRLASLSSRVSRVRTPAEIVSGAAEDRRRELRGRTPDPASGPTLGQVAFEAYSAKRGGKNHDGTPTPVWAALGEGVREGWEAAAAAARESA